ncbi:hypothetical protein [Desertivibrio insolitus]|uniref:hypothetical protein n=1 Tax=Herbiconiux sp. SYSU D00978 TaxID=2812562 RepID=UPI001A956356|nr:hypothetical protein [Herbiconiux sp. SYSU D00978]
MALFSLETIDSWLADFRALGHRVPGVIRTLERDLDAEGEQDAGLVLIKFELATTDTFLERPAHDQPGWRVHFAPRDEELVMSSVEVQNLAEEFHMVSRVASYLEARTAEALARLA